MNHPRRVGITASPTEIGAGLDLPLNIQVADHTKGTAHAEGTKVSEAHVIAEVALQLITRNAPAQGIMSKKLIATATGKWRVSEINGSAVR